MSATVRYHVNNDGRKMRCGAKTPESCDFSVENHISTDNPQEAIDFAEAVNKKRAEEEGGKFIPSTSRNDSVPEEDVEEEEQPASGGFDIFASLAAIQADRDNSEDDEEDSATGYDDIVVTDEDIHRAFPYQGYTSNLPELFGGEDVGYTPNEYLFSQSMERHSEDSRTGTFKTRNTGSLSDSGYFNADTVHGTIDYTALDDNSAVTQFGFKEIPQYEPYMLTEHNTTDMETFFEVSRAEIDQADGDEKRAADFYTGSDFRWINNSINGTIDVPDDDQWDREEDVNTVDFQTLTTFVTEDDREYDDTTGEPPVRTVSAVKRVVATLDSAIEKGPKRQRTVYHSVKGDASFFGGKSAGEWLDENAQNGSEIVFDGYQSTSPKTDGIKKFSQDNGVIFEILTPEGINVTSNSHFQDEFEVVLPRNARYMVVGSSRHVDIDFPHTHHTAYKDSVDNMTVVRLVAINSRGEVLDGTNSDPVQPWEPKVREPAFA